MLKYSVCCTQSALIHVRRKMVYPRAKNLARCEGLQLMGVITSVAELQKSVMACELQHLLSEINWSRSWLWSTWDYVCLYVSNRKLFVSQTELRWYQGLWMRMIWPQLYDDSTTDICTTLCWENVLIFYQREYVNIHGALWLSLACLGGCKGALFW